VRHCRPITKFGAAIHDCHIALFLWNGGNFVARNRAGRLCPDAMPTQLMPNV